MAWRMLLCAAACFIACVGHQQSRRIILILDLTASITASAQEAMMSTAATIARRLARGEDLVVVTVNGDALANAPGRVFRFHLDEHRAPYDADRTALNEAVRSTLRQVLSTTTSERFLRTDLIGAFDLAAEELGRPTKSGGRRIIICLSDWLQDDSRFDFNRSPVVETPEVGRREARELASAHHGRFEEVAACIGLAESTDFGRLSSVRREAVRAFWMEFLAAQGANVRWSSDGIRSVVDCLGESN